MVNGLTINDAVHKWVSGMNAFPKGMIEVLMRAKPNDRHEITAPGVGDRVYVYELPEENPDGKPYKSTEHQGEIAECFDQDTYRITMDDGESILVKLDDFEINNADKPPGWMWSFGYSDDNYWLKEPEGIKLMSECGFRVYKNDKWGYFFGIDGEECDFYEAYWIPLYKKRGLQWHDLSAEEGDNVG